MPIQMNYLSGDDRNVLDRIEKYLAESLFILLRLQHFWSTYIDEKLHCMGGKFLFW